MAAPNPNDPSGFIANPPSTIVKIINTSREDINGKCGIAVQFQQEQGRYLVHLTSTQNVVAMKPENLVKASYMEQAQAYYEQATKDPQIGQIVNRLTAYLPPGVTLQHAGIGVAVASLLLIYFLGFSRTMMLFSFIMLVMMVIGQDVLAGADRNTIIRNAPLRFQTIVREQMPGGNYLVGKPYEKYVHMALAAFFIVFFVRSMMPTGASTAAASAATATTTNPSRNLMANNNKMMEEYYKLGFDDATNQKEYGTSLPDLTVTTADISTDGGANYDAMDDLPEYPMPPPTRSSGGGGIMGMLGKLFNISSAMSLMYLGRTAMDLGRDATGAWSFPLFQQNLTTLEPWKLGLLGLSLYRLVSSVMK